MGCGRVYTCLAHSRGSANTSPRPSHLFVEGGAVVDPEKRRFEAGGEHSQGLGAAAAGLDKEQ